MHTNDRSPDNVRKNNLYSFRKFATIYRRKPSKKPTMYTFLSLTA